MSGKGGSSQARRRYRRAAARAAAATPTVTTEVSEDVTAESDPRLDVFDALIAAASGNTSLPLADRDVKWDSGAARKTLDPGQFADAHFWKDPDGDPKQIGSYKLPFAQVMDGKLTAIWGGVTGAAGAVQGARGGVKIPSGDVAGVKSKIGAYYTKAAKQYDDPDIKPPWESSESDVAAETFADVPDDDVCDNCDHPASMHADTADGDNTGACGAAGCDCGAMTAAAATPPELADVTSQTFAFPSSVQVSYPTGTSVATGSSASTSFVFTFDGATQPAIPAAHQEQETLPGDDGGTTLTAAPSMSWSAIICPEAEPTDDGRIFAPDAVSWRNLPLSLGAMLDTPHADLVTKSPVCGRIDEIWRDGNLIRAKGIFDNSEYGQEIARMVGDGVLRGVSVDIAVAKFEIAYRSEILDENGNWKGGDSPSDGDEGPGLAEILFGDTEDEIMFVVWDGIIGAVTVCPFPAFSVATIEPAASLTASVKSEMVWTVTQQAGYTVTGPKPTQESGLTAAAALRASQRAGEGVLLADGIPVRPSADLFKDPELGELTALTVDGYHIYGHAAGWETCHIGIPNVCTTAPHSETGYAYFHLKEVECSGGERVACGTLTMDTGHADRRLSRVDTIAHYDNTGTAVADIVCGEDEHGIWFSGAVRPTVDEVGLRKLRGAAVSGDWRNVNGNLEFVALLTVNVPGFPVPRARALVASGTDGEPEILALTAAGIYLGGDETEIRNTLTRDEEAQFAALRDLAAGEWDSLSST